MLPSQLQALSAVAMTRRLTTPPAAIAVIVAMYANTASAGPTQWASHTANDTPEGPYASEASFTLVWWLNFLIAVAGIGAAMWVVLVVVNWYRVRHRRAEDAVRSDEIEKSIRFMTARLYRTRQLRQVHQGQTMQQQQRDSCSEHLSHDTVRLCTDHPLKHHCEQRRERISCNASYVKDESSLTSNTAVPASVHLHIHPLPSLLHQQDLSPASRASSDHCNAIGGEDTLATSESDSLVSPLFSTHEVKSAAPTSSSTRSAAPASSLPSSVTRVFGGAVQIKALRRALRDPQMRVEQPTSPLPSTPSRRVSHHSFRLVASSRGKESQYYKSISSFQFPACPSAVLNMEADESFVDDATAVTMSVHGGKGGVQDPCATADGCFEKGVGDPAHCTGIAETDGRVKVSFHGDGVEEQDGARTRQQSHYQPAQEGELLLKSSPPGPRPQWKGDVASRSEIQVAEGSQVDCTEGTSSAAVQPLRTEHCAEKIVGGTLPKNSVSFLEASLLDETAGLQGRFTSSSRFKRAKGPDGSPTLHAFLSFRHFTPANRTPRGNTRPSSPIQSTTATHASLSQEVLHSTHTRRLIKSLQSSFASLPLSPPSEFMASTTAEEAPDGAVAY
ncbi:hypothetical protein LSCM4_06112 [Leishmania orientalis]|uniref:Uncharacterized protein n=1 Tax=Leishmania orientalis TaxID=2249476 RepID=A0A836GS54_9TRYP|nr:hypothetical protein LSCM4_06112 [Leishmania orientalis]